MRKEEGRNHKFANQRKSMQNHFCNVMQKEREDATGTVEKKEKV